MVGHTTTTCITHGSLCRPWWTSRRPVSILVPIAIPLWPGQWQRRPAARDPSALRSRWKCIRPNTGNISNGRVILYLTWNSFKHCNRLSAYPNGGRKEHLRVGHLAWWRRRWNWGTARRAASRHRRRCYTAEHFHCTFLHDFVIEHLRDAATFCCILAENEIEKYTRIGQFWWQYISKILSLICYAALIYWKWSVCGNLFIVM